MKYVWPGDIMTERALRHIKEICRKCYRNENNMRDLYRHIVLDTLGRINHGHYAKVCRECNFEGPYVAKMIEKLFEKDGEKK